jgi:deoxyribose-phosphate aldolase
MNIASKIEHTLLKADMDMQAALRLLDEALAHKLYGICIPPYFVRDLYRKAEGKPVKIITVVGFPMGFHVTAVKNEELRRALDEGADDVDVVVNLAAVKSGDWSYVGNEIETLTRSAHLKGKTIKLILETGLITQDECDKLVRMGLESGVDVFKTSTGFQGQAATVESVQLLKSLLNGKARIKASGGIRSYAQAMELLDAGADLLGTSASLELINAKHT